MVEPECPKCGRGGAVPKEKVNTRLVCKKCYSVFYVTTAGRTILGEPPHDHSKHEPSRGHATPHLPSFEVEGLRESVNSIPVKKLAVGLAALLVVLGGWTFLNQPPESLEKKTKEAAEGFANDDLRSLKELASAETVDDVVRWFDNVHPKLVKSREEWKSKGTSVRVMVIDENRSQRTGEAEAFVYPFKGPAHQASIASAAEAATNPVKPVDLKLFWTLDGRGRWRLDGLQTFEASNRNGGVPQ